MSVLLASIIYADAVSRNVLFKFFLCAGGRYACVSRAPGRAHLLQILSSETIKTLTLKE